MTAPGASEAVHTAGYVAQQTGITYRQLDYWVRTGRITPTVSPRGSGNRRLFTDGDLVPLRYAAALIKVGFTPDAALRNAQRLTKHYGTLVKVRVQFVPEPMQVAS